MKTTYHDALEHGVVALDSSVLQGSVEDLDGCLPVALAEVLLGLLESSVWGHVVLLVSVRHSYR